VVIGCAEHGGMVSLAQGDELIFMSETSVLETLATTGKDGAR